MERAARPAFFARWRSQFERAGIPLPLNGGWAEPTLEGLVFGEALGLGRLLTLPYFDEFLSGEGGQQALCALLRAKRLRQAWRAKEVA
jgi:hypothetical protein